MCQKDETVKTENLGMIADHTDEEWEYAYRKSPMGNLEKGIIDAKKYNWTIIDMKADWKNIFPFEKQ